MTPEQIEFYQKLANFIQYQNGENLEELYISYLKMKSPDERVSILEEIPYCSICGGEITENTMHGLRCG